MPADNHFSPGQTIVIREVSQGKVRRATPYIVVQDTPDLLAIYVSGNSVAKYPLTPEGKRTRPQHRVKSEWVINDLKFDKFCMLRLNIPGEDYSVLIFWDFPSMKHDIWYINLEDPLYRIPMGFEFNDLFLDVLINPDLSSWRWKDEDEFEEAIEIGLISPEKARIIRSKGEKVAKWIQSGTSPFNGWENWCPDPSWKVPILPDGWDRI
jgi:predicted RNA-binding protein associated with RNAse of E/G family